MSSDFQRAICGLAVVAAAAAAWAESPRNLELAVVSPPEEIEILFARPGSRLETRHPPVASDGRVVVRGGCVEGISVWVLAENALSLPIVVRPGAPCFEGLPHRVELLQAVRLNGSLEEEIPDDHEALALIDAPDCEPPRNQSEPPAFFPLILRGNAWHARLPRGCRALRLRFGAATPVSLGPVQLLEDARWPPLRLSHRAAAAGRVIQGETGHAMPDARVLVLRDGALARAVTAVLRGREPSSLTATTADSRGWFRLPDLPEGSLRLLVTAPGRAPAWSPAFEPEEAVEHLVPILEVEREGSLHVFTDTPGNLRVSASAMLPGSVLPEALLSVEVSPSGAARLDGLYSGEWLLELMANEPPDRFDVLARMPVQLLPGEDRVVSFPATAPPYRGNVTFEGEGVAAGLRFSPDGPGRVAVTHSAEDGTFSLWLEEPGRYRVDAATEDFSAVVPEVEIRHRDELVEIELPEGRISGRVEGDGSPVAGVLVQGLNLDAIFVKTGGRAASTSTATNAEGEFVLRGLMAGEWVLRARSPGRDSRPVAVVIGDDGEVEDVRLSLEKTSAVSIELVAPSGSPVVGAQLTLMAVPEGPFPAEVHERTSGADGALSVEVPRGASALNVAVHATGHPAYAWRLPASGTPRLGLPSQGGSVRIELSASAASNLPALVLASSDGGILSLSDLIIWGGASLTPRGDGMILEIRELGSGTWRLHRLQSMDEAVSLLRSPATAAPVAVFQIGPDGQAALSIP